MASPNDPNADDAAPIATNPPRKHDLRNPEGAATDKEAAGADGMGTGGSGPQDGEK